MPDCEMVDILIPTYRRPERIAGIVANIRACTPEPHRIVFICDEDESMNAARLAGAIALRNEGAASYAGAMNTGARWSDAAWVFLGADDLEFTPGWVRGAQRYMAEPWSVIGTRDGDWQPTETGASATHMFVRGDYIRQVGATVGDKPGELIYEGYRHYCAEQELVFLAKARGVYTHAYESLVLHKPDRKDEKAQRNEENRARDRALWDLRSGGWKAKGRMREIIRKPAEDYLAMLREGEPFAFARYGDGEILCMFPSHMSQNCDGSRFLPELVEPMKDVFRKHHPHYHALVDAAGFPSIAEQARAFEDFLARVWPDARFHDGEVWQRLAFEGRISELASALTAKSFALVGGEHLAAASRIRGMGEFQHIVTPGQDAFLSHDAIVKECEDAYARGARVFGFAAGFASKVLICHLWPILKGATLIDLGSVLDPFCGKLSRSGMVRQGAEWYKGFLK